MRKILHNNPDFPREEAEKAAAKLMSDEIWVNSRYQVNIDRNPGQGENWPTMIHLSVKRRDKKAIIGKDWRDMQRIKNELIGEEHEALELYPAESRLVDTSNQYHLWVFADPHGPPTVRLDEPCGGRTGTDRWSQSGETATTCRNGIDP